MSERFRWCLRCRRKLSEGGKAPRLSPELCDQCFTKKFGESRQQVSQREYDERKKMKWVNLAK